MIPMILLSFSRRPRTAAALALLSLAAIACHGAAAPPTAPAPAPAPAASSAPTASPAAPGYTARVDPTIQYQRFEGWGTSLAWWAYVVGGFPEPIRSDYMEKAFDPVRGLGLNIVRYNIGGGENPKYLAPNHQFLQYRAAVPGYEPAPGKWDWSQDATQRWVLKAAIARGANQLEAFSNSPPYWMTRSGSVTGNHNHADNVRPDAHAIFADYLTEVVKHFRVNLGITFRDLEPLNEPSGGWSFGNGQEGCHVDRPDQNAIVKATEEALALNHSPTSATASDEPSIGDADTTFGYYDRQTLHSLTKINTHSYGGGDRTRLWNFATSAGKDLWLSEYGDRDASGLTTSRRILQDMNELHPSAWVYWQVVDSSGGWGFLRNPLKDETTTTYTINKKYYVMANYSRFIRPGYRFIAITDPNSLAAYDARTRTLVIVTTNSGDDALPITYNLSGYTRLPSVAEIYRTSPSEDLAKLPGIALRDSRFRMSAPGRSVTTFVIKGAEYRGPLGFDAASAYTIRSRKSGLALSEKGDTLTDFTPVELSAGSGTVQQWRILGMGSGDYKLVNRNDGLLLEVGSGATTSGAALDLFHDKYEAPASSNQQWRLVRLPDSSYKILNARSGLALHATTSAVDQATYTGASDEQWEIRQGPGKE